MLIPQRSTRFYIGEQGKQITSRSEKSILKQVNTLKDLPEWKGYLSDLGGPSANMYGMHGRDMSLCEKCARPSCLHPNLCKNLNQDFASLLHIYDKVDQLPYIKKSFVGSGIRYDLMNEQYGRELITRHVSGRLKVAPEHTSSKLSAEHKSGIRGFLCKYVATAASFSSFVRFIFRRCCTACWLWRVISRWTSCAGSVSGVA